MRAKPRFSVDPGLTDDRVLRRYVDLAKYLSFVRSKGLYLCRADLFQDKFEGSFTPSIRAAIEGAHRARKIGFTYERFKKELREAVYINCWSLGANDNIALWTLYGGSEFSVAVTTTVSKLCKVFQDWKSPGTVAIRKVEYVKHWRDPKLDVDPYSNVFRYKVVAYSFEKEVRVILDTFPQNRKSPERTEGILVPVPVATFVRSVVVSPNAPEWFFDLIVDITQRYGIDVPVRRSKLASDPI